MPVVRLVRVLVQAQVALLVPQQRPVWALLRRWAWCQALQDVSCWGCSALLVYLAWPKWTRCFLQARQLVC